MHTIGLINTLHLSLIVLLVNTIVAVAHADDRPQPLHGEKGEANMDGEQTIEELANKNPPPVFRKGRKLPDFDESYDVSEDQRVWGHLRELGNKCESIFPSLIKHFDDRRYCITVSTPSGQLSNMTVGDVCYGSVSNIIEEGYWRPMRPQPKRIMAQLRNAEVRGTEQLREWCKKRDGKPLYVLQSEMCEWAIERLKSGEITMVLPEVVQEWITAIEAQKESLAKTKKPVESSWFQGEQFTPVRPPEKERK